MSAAQERLNPAEEQGRYAASGRVVVQIDRGFDQRLVAAVFAAPAEPVAIREADVYGINGTNFFVAGPQNGEPLEVVVLPGPLADLVKNAHKSARDAEEAWKRSTAIDLGGTLTTRNY